VMQVCRNGHVITDLLLTFPERGLSHCDRCGAATLDRCPTCGRELPGGIFVPGLVPVGLLQPPQYCSSCGAPFPWVKHSNYPSCSPLALLEELLRRLPRVIRQLRTRQGDRPPFRVEDERDLEDLLRALLPLHFDDIRPESRTPSYAAGTRTDFLLVSANTGRTIALTAKRATPERREPQLTKQLQEDAAYYARRPECRTLVGLVYDSEQLMREPHRLETAWSGPQGELNVRCVIAS